jgi:hypothetical protein
MDTNANGQQNDILLSGYSYLYDRQIAPNASNPADVYDETDIK